MADTSIPNAISSPCFERVSASFSAYPALMFWETQVARKLSHESLGLKRESHRLGWARGQGLLPPQLCAVPRTTRRQPIPIRHCRKARRRGRSDREPGDRPASRLRACLGRGVPVQRGVNP
jgi:hypothetical protein